MTRVLTRKIATVTLGNDMPLHVEAEYEPNGELNCLILKQRTEGLDETHMVVVAELEYVTQLVQAIRAVVPGACL